MHGLVAKRIVASDGTCCLAYNKTRDPSLIGDLPSVDRAKGHGHGHVGSRVAFKYITGHRHARRNT